MRQKTIKEPTIIHGKGLHSGQDVCLGIYPGNPDQGITFTRTDLHKATTIRAVAEQGEENALCTSITDGNVKIQTIEHLMSAINAMGYDNLSISLNGPEVPIMDGSAAYFSCVLNSANAVYQNAPKQVLQVLEPVEVRDGDKFVKLEPSETSHFNFEIDFDNEVIGHQTYDFNMKSQTSFRKEICTARTFGFLKDAEELRRRGLAKGAGEENAIIVDENRVLNKDGLRFQNEFVRHKILDAIGDIYLAGFRIVGNYFGSKSSHALNLRLLRKLFSASGHYRIIPTI